MITVTCPGCKEAIEVPDSLAGTLEQCPSCGVSVPIVARQANPGRPVTPPSRQRVGSSMISNRAKLPWIVGGAAAACAVVVVAIVLATGRSDSPDDQGVASSITPAVLPEASPSSPTPVPDATPAPKAAVPNPPAAVQESAPAEPKPDPRYKEYAAKCQPVLDQLARISSDIEVGINRADYGKSVRDLNYEWKKFKDSLTILEKQHTSAFLIGASVLSFIDANDGWEYKRVLQQRWREASAYTKLASIVVRREESIPTMICPSCDSTGNYTCVTCNGWNKITCEKCRKPDNTNECSRCNGTGKSSYGSCICNGTGREACYLCEGKDCKTCENTGKRPCLVCKGTGSVDSTTWE